MMLIPEPGWCGVMRVGASLSGSCTQVVYVFCWGQVVFPGAVAVAVPVRCRYGAGAVPPRCPRIEIVEKPEVFLGFLVAHRPPVAKTLCFPRVLRARLQKPYVFLCFWSAHDPAEVTRLHRPSNKSARTPTVASTVWGKIGDPKCQHANLAG